MGPSRSLNWVRNHWDPVPDPVVEDGRRNLAFETRVRYVEPDARRRKRAPDGDGSLPHVDSQMVDDFVAAARISGTIQSERRSTPPAGRGRALADAVVSALDGGDVVGARAAAAPLEFIERLKSEEHTTMIKQRCEPEADAADR